MYYDTYRSVNVSDCILHMGQGYSLDAFCAESQY